MRFVFVALALLVVAAVSVPINNDAEELRLIQTDPFSARWVTMAEIEQMALEKKQFMDITDHPYAQPHGMAPMAFPTAPKYQSVINPMITKINPAEIQSNVETMAAYDNRYFSSTLGVESANWIKTKIDSYFVGFPGNYSSQMFAHTWAQPSVIARITGTQFPEITLVIGGHFDSYTSSSAPAADDNASGVAAAMEFMRILAVSAYIPRYTIEFHAYSAEEVGLRGSQAVATAYASAGRQIFAYLNLDMVGYNAAGDEHIGVITDYTDATATSFMRSCIASYATIPGRDTACSYACSDHASWNKNGYVSVFPFEAVWGSTSPYIHTSQDKGSHINWNLPPEYVKVALGFLIECDLQGK